MNAMHYAGQSRSKGLGEVIQYRHPVNDVWLRAGLPARQAECEQGELLGEIDCLHAEIRHLKDELDRVTQERDMLRTAHRIIAVTIQAVRSQPSTEVDAPRPKSGRNNRNYAHRR